MPSCVPAIYEDLKDFFLAILLRVAAKAKLRVRSFSSNFSFSANVSSASRLRVSLLIEIPLLELLPFRHQAMVLQDALQFIGVNSFLFEN